MTQTEMEPHWEAEKDWGNDGEACRLLADKVLKRLQPSVLFVRTLIWLDCYSHSHCRSR
jgi:hypothetical protein